MEKERFDLAIAGAGLNGSLLALAAAEAGLSVALVDRVALTTMSEAAFDGRTTAVAYTSQRLFAALGLWDEVAAEAEPILDIRISDAGHDGRASPLFLHFDHREAAAEGAEAAPMGWIVENRAIRPGDVMDVVFASSAGVIRRPTTLAPYFVTVPAVSAWRSGGASGGSIPHRSPRRYRPRRHLQHRGRPHGGREAFRSAAAEGRAGRQR